MSMRVTSVSLQVPVREATESTAETAYATRVIQRRRINLMAKEELSQCWMKLNSVSVEFNGNGNYRRYTLSPSNRRVARLARPLHVLTHAAKQQRCAASAAPLFGLHLYGKRGADKLFE
ncbi:hypothetical protein BHE74_00000743 [Ensete ventricosum]|nr:hypothetical protein GW17_00007536 [Ensete ventricosum]RWW90115.1 hypothetical protein BHE74_00000743 [Ensete ventricosum]RZR97398.1 hypothetical protein BHM03_00026572 [Ensete ventricosum]